MWGFMKTKRLSMKRRMRNSIRRAVRAMLGENIVGLGKALVASGNKLGMWKY